jgi:hypothetical protein
MLQVSFVFLPFCAVVAYDGVHKQFYIFIVNCYYLFFNVIKVTGREGPVGCETSRLLYFLDNRLRDGGEVFCLIRRAAFIPRRIPGIPTD